MYDQVTLGLNVDPFILSALKEDITSEDVSTNSVMPHPQAGEVDLICKQDGIICGLQVFERVFTLLDADTKVEFYVKDGDRVENKQLIGKVYGDIRVLLCGEHEWNCHIYQSGCSALRGHRYQAFGYQKDNPKQ